MKDILNLIDTFKATHAYPRKSDKYRMMRTVVAGGKVSIGQEWRKENITTIKVVSGEVNEVELRSQLTNWIEKFDVNTALMPMYINLSDLETRSTDMSSEVRELAELKNEFRSQLFDLAHEKNSLVIEINTLKQDIIDFKAEVIQDKEFLESLEAEISALESSVESAPDKETDPFKIAKRIFDMDEDKYLQIRDEL